MQRASQRILIVFCSIIILLQRVAYLQAEPPTNTVMPAKADPKARRKPIPKELAEELKWFSQTALANASATVEQRFEPGRFESLIGTALLNSGDVDSAKEICRKFKDSPTIQALGGRICAYQGTAPDARSARAAARALGLPIDDENFHIAMAIAKAERGDFVGARSALKSLDRGPYLAKGLSKLARLSRDPKDLSAAIAARLPDMPNPDAPTIAEVQTLVGDLKAAMATAAQLNGPDHGNAMWHIARAQIDLGDLDGAQKTLAALGPADVLNGDHVRFLIAAAQANAGDVVATAATVGTVLQQVVIGHDATALVTYAQAKKGDFTAAVATGDKLKRHTKAACAAAGLIAACQIEKGDVAGAKLTLRNARVLLEASRDKGDNAYGALITLQVIVDGPAAVVATDFVDN